LFASVPDVAVLALLAKAVGWHGEALIEAQLRSASGNGLGLADCQGPVTPATRAAMATASKAKQNPWFKSVSASEEVAREIIGPHLAASDERFAAILNSLWEWMTSAR
jgi:hypothetical protein